MKALQNLQTNSFKNSIFGKFIFLDVQRSLEVEEPEEEGGEGKIEKSKSLFKGSVEKNIEAFQAAKKPTKITDIPVTSIINKGEIF
jgi:hypothetical protein